MVDLAVQVRQPRTFWRWFRFAIGMLAILAAVTVGFLVHSHVISHDDAEVLDEMVENRRPGITAWTIALTNVFSPLGTIIMALVAALLLWFLIGRWRVPVYIAGSVAIAAGITFALKLFFERGRPPLDTRLVSEVDYSYPSGHVTGTAALACAVAVIVVGTRLRLWLKGLVVLGLAAVVAAIAFTRIYLGIHWFTDTAAGACVGVGTAIALSGAFGVAGMQRRLPLWRRRSGDR